MTSVVRIKRRLSQEPVEALLLAAKRMKVENSICATQSVEENVFRFCGTSENEKENVETIAKLIEKGKSLSHCQSLKTYRSTRSKKQLDTSVRRNEKKYKVLSTLRNIDTPSDHIFKVYDLVLESDNSFKADVVTCNGIPLDVEKCEVQKDKEKYVYDFYYSDRGTVDDSYIDRLMSVQPYYFPEDHEDSDQEDPDDDSNDENNWRNDYPDTEEDEECDEDIVGKMCGMYLDQEDELSSDDEDFVYSKHDDDPRYSDAYSQYKKRVAKDLYETSSTDTDESSEPE